MTQSLARKKAPKRIPNSIATNWEIASFLGVESANNNTLPQHKNTHSGIYDDQGTRFLRKITQYILILMPFT